MHPAFVTLIVTITLLTLIAKAAPHRRVKVALVLWAGSVLVGALALGGSGWSSIVSFFLFWAMVFAKGVPMMLRGVGIGRDDEGAPA